MSTTFSSAQAQLALYTPTGYRRRFRCVFSRGGVTQELEPVSGTLTQDARRNGRWDGTLTFVGDDVLPQRPGDLLTPFGTTVDIEMGIELIDGSVFTVPYGSYSVTGSQVTEDADTRSTQVSLTDLSNLIERYRFESAFTVPSGTDLGTLVNLVVTDRTGFNPGVSLVGNQILAARVFGLDPATAPWSEILDVLDGFSRTAWYGRSGDIQVGSEVPDPTAAYSLDGMTSLSVNFDTQPANVVVARGEANDGSIPVQAVSIDSDPSSPTYAGTGPGTSPYGRVTQYFSSPLITTVSQAQSSADTILAGNIGAGATYAMTMPFEPTVDARDIISRGGTTYAVDAVSIDLMGQTTLQIRELG